MDAAEILQIARPASELSSRSRSIRAFASNRALVLLAIDVSMLALASWAAISFTAIWKDSLDYPRVAASALIWTLTSIWTFRALGLYRISFALSSRDEWYNVIAGLAIGVAPLLVLFTVVPFLSTSRVVLLLSFGLSVLVVGTSRSLIHNRFRALAYRRKRRCAIVGASEDLRAAAAVLDEKDAVVSFVPTAGTEEAMAEALSGGAASWYERLKSRGCDEIIFASMPTARAALMVEHAARDRVTVAFAPAGLSSQAFPLDVLRSRRHPILVAGRVAACTPLNVLLKRIFDVTVACVGVVLTAPIMAAAAIAISIESGRPVIFRQTRVGRDGKPFEILKFRSMVLDAEARSGPVWSVGDPSKDNRTTKVGAFIRKTSIDELPQFFNVLRGDMSIVGPRPERPVFVEKFRREFARYDERHLVPPGITGWAHAHMRRGASLDQVDERLDLDLFYIENYSPLLDVFVTFKTAAEVLFQRWS